MRLRVTVRRHGLPDTPVIWTIDTSVGPTVYHLLEQINEIIPVESDGEWGLEDYAVELKGSAGINYECLHFQPVANVMKEEDEVLIRPLLTQDLKIRRISGRRQISSSGAHLVDGVVFGRPLLRRPDRPTIDIPPRKKRRITDDDDAQEEVTAAIEDGEAEDSEDSGNKQLVLHTDFDDEDSEDDEDFVSGESESDVSDGDTEELDQEVQALEDEDQDLNLELQKQKESSIKEVIEPCLADVTDAATRGHIRKLHAAFPKAKLSVCKFVLSGSDYDMSEAYEALARGFRPVKPKSAVTEILQDHTQLLVPKTHTEAFTAPAKELKDLDSMQVDMDESPNPLVDYYDKSGLPPGSIASGRALSCMADAVKSSPARRRPDSSRSSIEGNKSVIFAVGGSVSNGLVSTPFLDKQSENDQSSDDDDDDSDDSSKESSSSDGESSSADSDSSEEEDKDEASSDSESDSSPESSSSDEEPEETSSKSNIAAVHKASEVPASKGEAGAPKLVSLQHVAPPGGGKKATQKRNERRRKANTLNRFKKKGILPAGTTLAEFIELDLEQLSSCDAASAALDKLRAARQAANIADGTSRALSKANEFENRRQDLLSSLTNGGVEVGSSIASGPETQPAACESPASREDRMKKATTSLEIGNESSISPSKERPPKTTEENMDVMDIDDGIKLSSGPEAAKVVIPTTSAHLSPTPEATSRTPRRKLDVGAGRRMLFASLGIKPPKTKQDEDKVWQDLMKDVRPLVTPKPVEPQAVLSRADDEDPDAWKAKITYRAVECVEEGVELSQPPFPFVQRWDPQQQKSWPHTGGRGGKRKKDQRGQSQYYDDSRASKKQKRRKGKHNYTEEHDYQEEPFELSYDDISIQHDGSILHGDNIERDTSRQMMNDTQETSSPDDLAVLPTDPSTLPDLANGAALVGMTIAFKCLEMNAATQWQPQVSPYRTAIVISIKDGSVLQLSLAKRDRAPAKVYDDETGERIYDKFEMPDDDEEIDEDDGNLNLSFTELLDPKIVQEPPNNIIDMKIEESTPSKDMPKFDTSAILSSQEDLAEAQLSHVTETVLSSDAPESTPTEEALQLSKQFALENIPESKAMQNQTPEEPISTQKALEIMKDILKEIPKSSVVQTHDTPMVDLPADDQATVTPTTPAVRAQSFMSIGVLTPSEQISEENHKAISHLIKDAGFRSGIPSSIVKGMDGAVDSPGDAAAFEKLINDMSETPLEKPYSPRFNGLGSSPPRSHAQSAKGIVLESSPAPEQQSRHEVGSSMKAHSSWETIDSTLESPAPSPAVNDGNLEHGMEELSEAHMSPSSPTPEPVRQVPERVPARRVPVGRAQALWESLQPKSRRASNDSSIGSEDISQEVPLNHAAPEEKDSNTSIQYPKLSVSSSFTSQIADHGRQPDYDFGDSTVTNSGKSSSFKGSQHRNIESDKASVKAVSKARDSNGRDPISDSDPELPTSKSINYPTNDTSRVSAGLEDTSSDEFPTLMTLSQRAVSVKSEQTASAPPKSKKERTIKKPLEVMDEGISDDDHETTPKPSQKQRQASQNGFPKGKETEKPPTQSRSTSSRPSQARPSQSQSLLQQGSQLLIDLTQSSDVEQEPPAPEVDLKFKLNDLGNNNEPAGWVSKKGTTLHGLGGGRRHTGNVIKNSSQADLIARDRRKTTGR